MWTSAAIRRYVGNVATQGHPDRVLAYHVSWSFLVIVELGHIAMRDGNIVVSIETTNSHGEKFLTGSAEVKQPTIVYVFTGQGSQEPGMGIDKLCLLGRKLVKTLRLRTCMSLLTNELDQGVTRHLSGIISHLAVCSSGCPA